MGQNLDCCRGGPNPGGGSVVETGLMTLDHQKNNESKPCNQNEEYSHRSEGTQKESASGRKKRKG